MVVPGPLRPLPVLPTVELIGRENEKGKEYGEDNKEWCPFVRIPDCGTSDPSTAGTAGRESSSSSS